ncbi:MAG TPA: DMT family transporter [Steroidobacteraceae bacterium]|nr:DMT family transporter [Steroidobacteraceae bacterium]
MAANGNLPGIVAMIVAAALFTVMDAGMKLLSQHYAPLQVTALRSLASFPLVYVYVAWSSSFKAMLQVRWPLHVARGALAVFMLASFVYGLHQLPMTVTYAIFYVAPLLITALSVPLLGERVGWARWLAIGIGLAGMLVVLRPTGANVMTLGGLAVIASAVCYAISAIAIRTLGRTDSMESLMFWLISMLALGSTALAWPHWQPVRAADAWIIVGVGITGFCGQWGVTYAFRHGEVSAVAPFEYTSLVWTLGLDRLIWNTAPDGYTLLGAAIIIAAGLFLVRRERVHVEAEHP